MPGGFHDQVSARLCRLSKRCVYRRTVGSIEESILDFVHYAYDLTPPKVAGRISKWLNEGARANTKE